VSDNNKGFVTKGSAEYFAEREKKINARIVEAKSKIDEIESKVRDEIVEITASRELIQQHLSGFVQARNELVQHRSKTIALIESLNSVVSICDTDLPVLDKMLDELEVDYTREDDNLAAAEKSRHRQLNKHVRAKTRYELRSIRLSLRKKLMLGSEPEAQPVGQDVV